MNPLRETTINQIRGRILARDGLTLPEWSKRNGFKYAAVRAAIRDYAGNKKSRPTGDTMRAIVWALAKYAVGSDGEENCA